MVGHQLLIPFRREPGIVIAHGLVVLSVVDLGQPGMVLDQVEEGKVALGVKGGLAAGKGVTNRHAWVCLSHDFNRFFHVPHRLVRMPVTPGVLGRIVGKKRAPYIARPFVAQVHIEYGIQQAVALDELQGPDPDFRHALRPVDVHAQIIAVFAVPTRNADANVPRMAFADELAECRLYLHPGDVRAAPYLGVPYGQQGIFSMRILG